MILYEAALKTNVGGGASQPAVVSESLSILGRPGCAVLPLTISTGEVALSFGCKGNRTFTGLPDNEVYVCVPGARWPSVVERLVETLEANATMGTYYTAQRARFQLD